VIAVAAGIAVSATGFGVGASPAVAAAAQPDFKLPFRCGQAWQASTYDYYQGHFHGNAVDFNLVGAEDRGEPVLAAAAGVVERSSPGTGDVVINHGGGWKTRYLHMADLSVTVGRYVSEGRWIGRVDTLGLSSAPHLHFEALRDGRPVKPVIDGVQVTVTPTSTQNFTSRNCQAGAHGVWFANDMIRAPDGTVDFVTASGARSWVPNGAVVNCLAASGARLRNVTWFEFGVNPRNLYGDPGGRWADCSTWMTGWLVKGSGPAVWYVAHNGLRYHVPSEAVVQCLGGWAAVRPVSDAQLGAVPANPWATLADCQTPLRGRLVKGSGHEVYFVGTRGARHYVSSGGVVDCLGGWSQVVAVRDSRLGALRRSGLDGNCNVHLANRLIRKADGQVDYVSSSLRRYWVPNGAIVGCLGGWSSTVFLANARFNGIPRNGSNAWATCSTKG
jgi:hypothetical protein